MTESPSKNSGFRQFIQLFLLPFCMIGLGAALLSLIHIDNGFPLVLGDSKGYIERAIRMTESSHWSNTYTVFLTMMFKSFGTLHAAAIIQNICVAIVLYIFSKYTLKHFNYFKYLGITIVLLFTTLPWISTMLMSDIFTPVCLIGVFLILDRSIKLPEYLILIPILFLGFSAHQSHLLIVPVFAFLIILFQWITGRLNSKLITARNLAVVFGLMMASNYFEKNIMNQELSASEQAAIQKVADGKDSDISSGFYFVAIRIRESGQMQNMLNSLCEKSPDNYLCDAEGDEKGPWPKNVTYAKRNENNKKYVKYATDNKALVMHSIKRPRFYFGMIGLATKRGFKLLMNTRIRKYNTLKEGGNRNLIRELSHVSPSDARDYELARQYKRGYIRLIRDTYSKVDLFWWVFMLPASFVLFLVYYIKRKKKFKIEKEVWFGLVFLVLGHVINCMVCGTFSSNTNLRYSSRTLWLVNFAVLLFIMSIISAKQVVTPSVKGEVNPQENDVVLK